MNWNNYLRGIFVSLFIWIAGHPASAQMEVQKGIEGKTFYDTAHEVVHEAYEYKLRYRMIIDPRTGDAIPLGEPEEIKNGIYIRYREDGTIECTGYYKNDVACGHWKYMDETGKVLVREEYLEGPCIVGQ